MLLPAAMTICMRPGIELARLVNTSGEISSQILILVSTLSHYDVPEMLKKHVKTPQITQIIPNQKHKILPNQNHKFVNTT